MPRTSCIVEAVRLDTAIDLRGTHGSESFSSWRVKARSRTYSQVRYGCATVNRLRYRMDCGFERGREKIVSHSSRTNDASCRRRIQAATGRHLARVTALYLLTQTVDMWPSYVINLTENTTRMDNSARQLTARSIPFERIDAVNGWVLPESEIGLVYDAEVNRRRAKHPLLRPEIGCYLSHLTAWRRVAEGESAGGFIFEDDFLATEDFAEVLSRLCEDERDWDMVKLFSLDQAPRTVTRRLLSPRHEIVVPFRVPACTMGYGLTREAASHLAKRAIPFFRPVDEDQKFFWETGLRVALVLPSPVGVGDQQTMAGTIGEARRSSAKRGGAQAWCSLIYQFRYLALLHWHRMQRKT